MTWVEYGPLLSIVVGYLVFLFGVAYAAERTRRLESPRLTMLTYVLTASVYCTAWTFYGSVGLAANRGLEFLTIYLGPALVALLWPTVLRKLVRVAKAQRITTISDLIASRYGVGVHEQGPHLTHDCLVVLIDGAGVVRGRYGADQLAQVGSAVTTLLAEHTGR